ncbi:hypothetical protein [Sphingobacterium detergens]|uniref:hypothetical protein n=1 Tax=Sphingobacterium detergens TaxID=1145106 RepID=UPI003AB0594E
MAREYALRLLALDQYTGKPGEWREWGGENIYGYKNLRQDVFSDNMPCGRMYNIA